MDGTPGWLEPQEGLQLMWDGILGGMVFWGGMASRLG